MRHRRLIVAACCCIMSSISLAAPFTTKDSRFGANTLIVDSATGIEWLRLDITNGLSVESMSQSFATGAQFSGFAFADYTATQLLLVGAGFATATSSSLGDLTAAASFAALMTGRTDAASILGVLPHGQFDNVSVSGFLEPTRAIFSDDGYLVNRFRGHPGMGVWAVSTTATPPVPEPSTYAMLLTGLLMMGFIVKRKLRSQAS